jgi:hypothetical protein
MVVRRLGAGARGTEFRNEARSERGEKKSVCLLFPKGLKFTKGTPLESSHKTKRSLLRSVQELQFPLTHSTTSS